MPDPTLSVSGTLSALNAIATDTPEVPLLTKIVALLIG